MRRGLHVCCGGVRIDDLFVTKASSGASVCRRMHDRNDDLNKSWHLLHIRSRRENGVRKDAARKRKNNAGCDGNLFCFDEYIIALDTR
jgi:hypothetical protein